MASTKNGAGRGRVVPSNVTRSLLHRFEERRLRFRRGTVDFVGEQDVGENGPGAERHLTAIGAVLKNVRAENVARHQVGRELHAFEVDAQKLGSAFTKAVLPTPGTPSSRTCPRLRIATMTSR